METVLLGLVAVFVGYDGLHGPSGAQSLRQDGLHVVPQLSNAGQQAREQQTVLERSVGVHNAEPVVEREVDERRAGA